MLNYQFITKKEVEKYFFISEADDGVYGINISNMTKPIYIKFPFFLNEDVASFAGLMPDGSLIRDLMRIYFHQKKDLSKLDLFSNLIKKLFSHRILLFRKKIKIDGGQVYVNSKTLAWFFYYILDISKSDEQMKVPKWIFESPDSVKKAYLKQIFDMEGTILKKLNEIRFVSKDERFAKGVVDLLNTLNIKSHLTYAPRIKQKSWQYRVSIYRKENFERFVDIGFDIPFLKERFNQLIIKYGI